MLFAPKFRERAPHLRLVSCGLALSFSTKIPRLFCFFPLGRKLRAQFFAFFCGFWCGLAPSFGTKIPRLFCFFPLWSKTAGPILRVFCYSWCGHAPSRFLWFLVLARSFFWHKIPSLILLFTKTKKIRTFGA